MRTAGTRADDILTRLGVPNPVGAEIGVFRGVLSERLLTKHPTLFLYMVDPWVGHAQPRHGKSQAGLIAEATRRTKLAAQRRKIVRLTSVEAAKTFEDHSLDFAFIDADHSYEAVWEDILAWLPKVRPDGLLCGHDYNHAHSVERGYGVCRAVDEACERYGWTLDVGQNWTWFVRL